MEKVVVTNLKIKGRRPRKRHFPERKGKEILTISIGNVCGAPEDGNYKYAHDH